MLGTKKNEKNTNEGICMIIYLLNYFWGEVPMVDALQFPPSL
jgi:hypothetical protein